MENIKKELKTFQQLKDLSLPCPKDNLDDLIKKKNIFDINPNTNYELLTQLINSSSYEDLVQNFYDYNQTLTFSQRQNIIKKLENTEAGKIIAKEIGLSKESYMEKYFSILNELRNFYRNQNIKNYRKIKKLFETKYYVDNNSIKIPLIYGTNELKYSGLINNLYQCLFFINTDNQIDTKEKEIDKSQSGKDNSNIQHNSSDNSVNIIKNKDNKAQNKNIPLNKQKDIQNNEFDDELKIYRNFKDNVAFIADYLDIICDDEFQEVFNVKNQYYLDESKKFIQEYQLSPDIDSLFFHLLFFDLIININIYQGDFDFDETLKKVYFENRIIKSSKLNLLTNYCKIYLIEDNKEINFDDPNDVKNQDYIMEDLKNPNNTFIFNPYDFIFYNFKRNSITKFQDIVNAFNNPENFSLNKIYKIKNLFNDYNLFISFKENIKNMLKSNVINQLYNVFENYKDYNNPYQGENKDKFINQIFDIILYMPIPFKYIAGFTYKRFGIIFLNNIEPLKKNSLPNTYFIKQICNVSFKKVVLMHEILYHYPASLVNGNDISYEIKTPRNTFIDYCPMEDYKYIYSYLDRGEREEFLLFGNKIHLIFVKGALYILDNGNFNNNNLDNFREKFIKINDPKKCTDMELNIKEEIEKNKIISFIKNKAEVTDNFIKITKSNSILSFRMLNSENDDEPIFEDGVLYVKTITHKDITFKPRKRKIIK